MYFVDFACQIDNICIRGPVDSGQHNSLEQVVLSAGGVAERLNAAVLKTVEGYWPSVGSNPTPSATGINNQDVVIYSVQ